MFVVGLGCAVLSCADIRSAKNAPYFVHIASLNANGTRVNASIASARLVQCAAASAISP